MSEQNVDQKPMGSVIGKAETFVRDQKKKVAKVAVSAVLAAGLIKERIKGAHNPAFPDVDTRKFNSDEDELLSRAHTKEFDPNNPNK